MLPHMDTLTPEDIRELLPELDQIHAQLDAVEKAATARFDRLDEQLRVNFEALSATLRSNSGSLENTIHLNRRPIA